MVHRTTLHQSAREGLVHLLHRKRVLVAHLPSRERDISRQKLSVYTTWVHQRAGEARSPKGEVIEA